MREEVTTERMWRYYGSSGWQYSERSISVYVDHYTSMTYATANTQAGTMRSDSRNASGVGTLVTATVESQNDAGAYRIVKTTQTWGAWGAWT